MWTNDDWAAFTAAVAPHGWAPYVEDGSSIAHHGCLTHPSMPGGVVRVESHAGRLVTDYATASNGTSRITINNDWDRAAKRWADGPGARRVAYWRARREEEARKGAAIVAVNARAESLVEHAGRAGIADPYMRPAARSWARDAIVDMGPVRVTFSPSGRVSWEVRSYGTTAREAAAALLVLADWLDAHVPESE